MQRMDHVDRSRGAQRAAACCVVAVLLTLPGCGASKSKLSTQNDELRRSNLELGRAVDDLNQQLAQRERELSAMHGQAGGSMEGVDAPRLAGIELDRLTGVLPPEAGEENAQLRVYLRPVDQDGRVMTVAGTARVRLIYTPADGAPITLVDADYDADRLHAAYRDGITGTHYTLKESFLAPLDDAIASPLTATLHVALTDAATGRVYAAERVVALTR